MVKVDIDICKNRLLDKQQTTWLATLLQKPKLRFYALFKNSLKAEKYVQLNLSCSERSVLAQIRMGILRIHIETGRFNNTKVEERLCKVCNENAVEDENHFLFDCSAYDNPRTIWVNSIYNLCPHFHYLEENDQLQYIFHDMPRTTAKFIIACMAIRKTTLYK
jgi:hypothetical protein